MRDTLTAKMETYDEKTTFRQLCKKSGQLEQIIFSEFSEQYLSRLDIPTMRSTQATYRKKKKKSQLYTMKDMAYNILPYISNHLCP